MTKCVGLGGGFLSIHLFIQVLSANSPSLSVEKPLNKNKQKKSFNIFLMNGCTIVHEGKKLNDCKIGLIRLLHSNFYHTKSCF